MDEDTLASQAHGVWFKIAHVVSILGGLATLGFLIWWFIDVSGHCGVVRFYEQAFGVFILGVWAVGTIPALLIVRGRHREAKTVIVGSLVAISMNVVAVGIWGGWLISCLFSSRP